MTQRDIDRAVARATGETVGRVHQMGFTLIVVPPQPRAWGLEAGKSAWAWPSVSPSVAPLSPDAAQIVTPAAAASAKASSIAVMA